MKGKRGIGGTLFEGTTLFRIVVALGGLLPLTRAGQ